MKETMRSEREAQNQAKAKADIAAFQQHGGNE
jgi:hypothetical protein